jgi:hypothetical protein
MIVAMAVSLGVPYRFNQLNLLSKKTLRPRSRDELVAVAIKVAGVIPKGTCSIPGRPQRVIYGMFTMVSA